MSEIYKEYERLLGGSVKKLTMIPKVYDQYKRRAKRKNMNFNLSLSQFDFLSKQPCFHCGVENLDKPMGVDRVDNNKGYIPSNVSPCCWDCNRSKSDMSQKEFYDYKQRIRRK